MNQEVNVVGMTFVNKDPLFEKLRPSGVVELIPDPTNKYDSNAIGVWIDDPDHDDEIIRIGFIPAKDGGDVLQREILAMKDADKQVIAEVVRYAYMDKDIGFNDEHIGRLQACTLYVSDSKEAKSYVEDGKSYRRLTDLLGCYEPDGKDGADRIIKWACDQGSFKKYLAKLNSLADAGTDMHKANEDWINGMEEAPVPQGFLNFWDKYQPEIVAAEQRVHDEEINVAGTFDLLCYITIDGERLLVAIDWKSSKAVRKKHRIQVGWYANKAGADEGWVICFGGTQKQGFGLSRIDKETCAKKARQVDLIAELQSLE